MNNSTLYPVDPGVSVRGGEGARGSGKWDCLLIYRGPGQKGKGKVLGKFLRGIRPARKSSPWESENLNVPGMFEALQTLL